MNWLILAGTVVVLLWPNIALWNERELTEADLVDISPKYQGLNGKLLRHVIAEASVMAILFAPLIFSSILSESQRTGIMTACVIGAIGAIGLLDAWFAHNLGVYPAAKYFGLRSRYTYSGTGKVGRVAKYQMGLTATLVGVAIVYFLIVMFR